MPTEETHTPSGLFVSAEPIAIVRHRHELNLSAGDDKGGARDDAGKDKAGKDDSGDDRSDDSGDDRSDDSGDDSSDTKDDSGGDDTRDDS
jgi:hypothetical protein